MKHIIITRLRFLGRNVKQAGKLSPPEFLKLTGLLHHYNSGDNHHIAIDRTLLDILFQLNKQYCHTATTLKPLLDEYKTLVAVMSQGKNHPSTVLRRYDEVLALLQHAKAQADVLIREMKHMKSYLELPQYAAVSHFVEESKALFTAMQRDFVEFYEPMVGVVEGNSEPGKPKRY